MQTSSSSHRDAPALERRRLNAARLFHTGVRHAEIARELGVSRAAVRQWFVLWKTGGKHALRAAGRLGRKPKLTQANERKVARILTNGPRSVGYSTDLWTLERIASVVKAATGVQYETGSIWYVLGRLGWTCQKPESHARERDPAAIARWRKTTWPAWQKKGSA
jgi:transposase